MEGYFQPGSDTVSSIVAATTEGSSKAVRSLDGLRDYIDSALQRLKRLK